MAFLAGLALLVSHLLNIKYANIQKYCSFSGM